jgi:hypothetical protein
MKLNLLIFMRIVVMNLFFYKVWKHNAKRPGVVLGYYGAKAIGVVMLCKLHGD